MKAFIDELDLIRIETNKLITEVYLEDEKLTFLKSNGNNHYFKKSSDITLNKTDHIYINHVKYPLKIGFVTLTDEFEKKYRYGGKLGVEYHEDYSIFRVYTPVAKEVFLVLDDEYYEMTYKNFIYEIKLDGNHEGKSYDYYVRLVDRFEMVEDPYKLSDKVINLSKTIKVKPLKNVKHPIIYEAHVRDLTSGLKMDNNKKYSSILNKAVELKNISVLDYIKSLNVTYIQFLPIQSYFGVNSSEPDYMYNWGYNPKHYFKLSSWLSSTPDDDLKTINEVKNLINEIHTKGLGVIMDVVYNHVYERHLFPYDRLVPGYFYKHDNKGKPTNSSFCGNDVETRRYMVRKLIVDSLKYFVSEFKIDGLRFDLMGLMDIKTMKEIEKELKLINPNIFLHGEGWHMDSVLEESLRASIPNASKLKKYSFFNDHFRNTFKGMNHSNDIGLWHLDKKVSDVKKLLIGSPHMFKSFYQSTNYIECHDNDTFYDRLDSHQLLDSSKRIYYDFGNHLVLIAKGIPFIHAGSEVGRTKFGVENSYKDSDIINQMRYKINHPSLKKFKKLVKIRNSDIYQKGRAKVVYKDKLFTYTLNNDKTKLTHLIKLEFGVTKYKLKNSEKLIFSGQESALDKENTLFMYYPGVYIIKS